MQAGALGRPYFLKISIDKSSKQIRYPETKKMERCSEAVVGK